MGVEKFRVTSPTLTIVLDDTRSGMEHLPDRAEYRDVDWDSVEELRLIIHKTPAWLDNIAQRDQGNRTAIVDIKGLATQLLAPLVERVAVPITIYLFRDLEQRKESLDTLREFLEEDLTRRHQARVDKYWKQGRIMTDEYRPLYTIKTLNDYISEGLEDELLWQELQYWRGENTRRFVEVEDRNLSEIDELI